MGLVMPPGGRVAEVKVTLDLPRGTWLIAGGIGGAHALEIEGEKVDDGAFTRYRFVAKAAESNKSWG